MSDKTTFFLHSIAWGILLIVSAGIVTLSGTDRTFTRYLDICFIPLVLYISGFYLNYFVFIDKYLFPERRVILFLLVNLCVLGSAALLLAIWNVIRAMMLVHPFDIEQARVLYISTTTTLLFVIVLSVGIKSSVNWFKAQSEKQNLEKERTRAELQNLKGQLNPHFLFNSLNNIYYLAKVDADKTQEAIYSLSNLLRYILYENNESLISLKKEIGFMKSYIELMKMRYTPEQVKVTLDLPPDGYDYKIAPLLFITLIENAFKHGINPLYPSFINIDIHLVNEKPSDKLICNISNSYFPKETSGQGGSGIGLENLHKRLMLIYPEKHIFTKKQDDKTFAIHLELTL